MTGMMIAGLVMTVAGGVSSAVQQGNAARQAASASVAVGNYNKSIAEYNATLATQEAGISRQIAANKAEGIRQTGEQHVGAERAILGARGVDILDAEGSPLLALQQTAADYASIAELEIYNGEVGAISKENEASLYRSQGDFAAFKGQVEANSYLAQAPSTLGTVLKVGGSALTSMGSFGGGASGTASGPTSTIGMTQLTNGSFTQSWYAGAR